jgi:hypothetical protein
MQHKLWEVFKHPAPTQGLKWGVQFPHGIMSYRTKRHATEIAQASKILRLKGKKYYVDPVNGDDSNSGLSPSQAVKTLAAGQALVVDGHNDVLMILGNADKPLVPKERTP